MEYHISKTVALEFQETIIRVKEELKKEGFGILTEIKVNEALKNKLDVDFRKYTILGACNPPFAYKALQAEDKIGTMLPCNVVIQEHEPGKVEISAINPGASMQAVENKSLEKIASEITRKLTTVINNI